MHKFRYAVQFKEFSWYAERSDFEAKQIETDTNCGKCNTAVILAK